MYCLDDGVHFPFYDYSDVLLVEDDMITNDEIVKCVNEHARTHFFEHHIGIENLMKDPGFIRIEVCRITVEREIKTDDALKIFGPAKDYSPYLSHEDSLKAYEEIKRKLDNDNQ